jgi:hypothetical protein
MSDIVQCVHCGGVIEIHGRDYRGDPRWVHRSSGSIQCSLFARPPEEAPALYCAEPVGSYLCTLDEGHNGAHMVTFDPLGQG